MSTYINGSLQFPDSSPLEKTEQQNMKPEIFTFFRESIIVTIFRRWNNKNGFIKHGMIIHESEVTVNREKFKGIRQEGEDKKSRGSLSESDELW